MVVAHNLLAANTNRQLGIITGGKKKSTEKLASGYRINRSADDAAGLTISEKMRWQVRGLDKASNNIQDGVSILQVADGALNEVHSMLGRMKELSVQAANDTNTDADRRAIQSEIDALITEIDRIGADTEFNTKKIFVGGYEDMIGPDGKVIQLSQIPVSDFQLASSELKNFPFMANSDARELNLSVSTVSGYTSVDWRLIYGNGSTSHSGLRVSYLDDNGIQVTKECAIEKMKVTNPVISADGSHCTRTFEYDGGDGVKFNITQDIQVTANNGDEQYYQISWKLDNVGQRDVDAEFLFNADTAYLNDDYCEEYYLAGNKVDQFCLYTNNADYLAQGATGVYDISTMGTDGFSIINAEKALPFSEKIKWNAANRPDTVCIGAWPERTGNWSYYDNLSSHMGKDTQNRDIAFSLIWSDGIAKGTSQTYAFDYGIKKASSDANLTGVPVAYDNSSKVAVDYLDLWIQSGATDQSGLYITIDKMNSSTLGLRGLDVTSYWNASQANAKVDQAIEKLSAQRSKIGAQQNRLEHAKAVDDNISENTSASESRIRDTDMAKEMVTFSKHSILEQAGQAMLAQANQSTQGALSLIQ